MLSSPLTFSTAVPAGKSSLDPNEARWNSGSCTDAVNITVNRLPLTATTFTASLFGSAGVNAGPLNSGELLSTTLPVPSCPANVTAPPCSCPNATMLSADIQFTNSTPGPSASRSAAIAGPCLAAAAAVPPSSVMRPACTQRPEGSRARASLIHTAKRSWHGAANSTLTSTSPGAADPMVVALKPGSFISSDPALSASCPQHATRDDAPAKMHAWRGPHAPSSHLLTRYCLNLATPTIGHSARISHANARLSTCARFGREDVGDRRSDHYLRPYNARYTGDHRSTSSAGGVPGRWRPPPRPEACPRGGVR